MMADGPVLFETSPEGVAVVTLNRPDKRNAFDEEMIGELVDTFRLIRDSENVRVVLLRGAGASFCAGADIDWMRRQGQMSVAANEEDGVTAARMFKALYDLPQLTIALVHGAAMGGGAGLVAACDVAIALTSTNFRFSEVRLGLIPAMISPYVVAAIGSRWATALFTTAEGFDGAFAEKIGLVHYAVRDMAAMETLAEQIANLAFAAAPGAVADSKALVRFIADPPTRPLPLETPGLLVSEYIVKETAKRIAQRRASEEGREGLSAFLEKRKPRWET
jgi:methylglutaconyl-CoA hydratase